VRCDMHEWSEIRRRVLTGEISKRAACREYDLGWHTLKKILEHEVPPGYRLRQARRKPKLEPYLPIIEQILRDDQKAPKKQRHTAKRIFERLRDEHGFAGGYTIVKEAVRKWKQSRKEVFLPLSHPPGEAQVDFGEATIKLGGVERKAALFVMTLPYSGTILIQAFPRECTETFLEGHCRAFDFLGGVPRRISYDNTSIAVTKVLRGRERQLTQEFFRLKSSCLFQEHFCLVRRANEKGHVERLLGFARRNFLVPVPDVASFEALNRTLLEHCQADLSHRTRGRSGTKGELLTEDQAVLLPLPKQRFEPRQVTPVSADTQSLVRFETNSYSVPVQYAHRKLTVVATIGEVRVISEDRLVARHPRCWDKEQFLFEPIHYLALLERKPGGFDHARPLENWQLPECFALLRRRLEAEHGGSGTRLFIRVLRLLELFSLKQLADAVEYALDLDIADPDGIRVIVEHRSTEPIELFSLDGRPELASVRVEATDVAAYQSLLAEGRP